MPRSPAAGRVLRRTGVRAARRTRRVDGRIRRRRSDTRGPDSARVRLRSGGRGARARSPTDSITATQPNYPGSVIPQSFELSLPNCQSVWVHGNATEHMAEYAQMVANDNPPGVVRLTTQQQQSSLQSAVNTATQGGVPYSQLIKVGSRELKFSPPRQPGQLPALIHALHTGK